MSTESEKLAKELRKVQASKPARERAVQAAMGAFDVEFPKQTEAAFDNKTPNPGQGFPAEPRLTSQITPLRRVSVFGKEAMMTLRNMFTKRTAMMAGSSMAVLLAVLVVLPANDPGENPLSTKTPADVATNVKPDETPHVATLPQPAHSDTPKGGEPSNVVIIERQVVKTPARTQERVVPPITKMQTRRVIKTPARTEERVTPAVTKVVSRRVKVGGEFKTVTESVVVQPQSIDYVTIPAEYETIKETVVLQNASTELVTVPAVYDTVRETIRIDADGSTQVLKSETIPAAKAVNPAGGITSVSDLLASVPADAKPAAKEVKRARDTTFGSVSSSSGYVYADVGLADEVIVTASHIADDSAASSAPEDISEDISEDVSGYLPGFLPSPVSVGSKISDDRADKTGIRTVERVVPAITKSVTRRVIKTPASTQERVIPEVTKDVTVQVKQDDGTYKSVTKTFVIREASTELVSVPSVYETVVETVVVKPAYTEKIMVDADGKIVSPAITVKRPKPLPQSGRLTAGDYDDVLNPDLYKIYLDKMLQGPLSGKDLPYVDADQRISIRVVDRRGQPVAMANISVLSVRGKTLFPLRTGADGMAYLYPDFDGLGYGAKIKISAIDGRAVKKKLTRKLLRDGGELEVGLNFESTPVKSLDLLLTIDATGSMGDEMRYLQSELQAIVERIEAAHPGIDIRTGLVVYRDKGDEYVVREVPFTDDIEQFRMALAEQRAGGGGDFPEAMHSAMRAGLDMDWRDDAIKINVLVADAPPHNQHLSDTWDAGLISRTQGIQIVPLAASGVDKTAEFLLRSMAQITNGRFLFLTDDSGIGNPHAEPSVDCYVVTRLDGLLTRVLSSLIQGERVEPEAKDVIRSVGNYRSGICAIDPQNAGVTPQTASVRDEQE